MTQPVVRTTAAESPFADLAATTGGQVIAPPYAGGNDGIQRNRVYPRSAPPDMWTSVRIDLAGGIVAQLGSRPTTARRAGGIRAGYEFVQTVPAGNHFWTAALRTLSVSRLPAQRSWAYGYMRFSAHPYIQYQELVPGRTHLFTAGQSMLPAGTYRIECGVLVSLDFGPGQSAYAEAIATLQSLVRQAPSWLTAEGDVAARAAAAEEVSRLDAIETEVREGADGSDRERSDEVVFGLD